MLIFLLAKPNQKFTYVPPKVSKEQYLHSIFKILNIPEAERIISYQDPTPILQQTEPQSSHPIYEYSSIEECPVNLLRKFLSEYKIEVDPKYVLTSHCSSTLRSLMFTFDSAEQKELVEKVKDLKTRSKTIISSLFIRP